MPRLPLPLIRLLDAIRLEAARISRRRWYFEQSHRHEFFAKAFTTLAYNGIDGDYAEFGCWQGMTFGLAYRESRRVDLNCKLWALDSFSGLPPSELAADYHPQWTQHAMSTGLEEFHRIMRDKRVAREVYEVVPGYYSETLARDSSHSLPQNICLAYIDCDLYSSTRTVLEFLAPRLKHGMIIAFDDYYCYSPQQPSGERRACKEFFTENPKWELVPYAQFGWHGMSFIVERRTASAPQS